MTTFFSSDTHFGHARIQEYQPNRPRGSVQDMNEAMIDAWNAVVGPYDDVWFLGDFAMGQIANSLPMVQYLNGHIIIVGGNHDRFTLAYGKMSEEKREGWYDKYREAGFVDVIDGAVSTTIGDGIPVQLCHFPYISVADHVDEREAQYDRWRPIDDGRILLHGHVHGAYGAITGERQIDVGIDVADWDFAPVAEDTLVEYIERAGWA